MYPRVFHFYLQWICLYCISDFRPYKRYIFWKLLVWGYLNWYSQVSHTQIHKYKYTNTQIHKYSIWQSAKKTQHVVYFWKEDCSRIRKMIFPCVKHANTKIQIQNAKIQHLMKCQKDPTCGIFFKRISFKEIRIIYPFVKHAYYFTIYIDLCNS